LQEEEKETRVFAIALALTLTLAFFQSTFATDFAEASSVKESFGGYRTPNGQKLQPAERSFDVKILIYFGRL
jgi:hypothetical protein